MLLRKDWLIPIDETNWPEQNPQYYTYMYMEGSAVRYAGQGSDGNANKKKRFARARNILNGGHNMHCIDNIDNITSIKIIGGFDDADKCTMNEAAHIKFFNLLDSGVGWNLREEMVDQKFYTMLETMDGNNSDVDIPTLIYYMMRNATGSSSVEDEKLAGDFLQCINFDHRKVVLVGNDGYGGYNFLKNLVEMQDNIPREISLIVSQEFLMKIGVDGIMNNRALSVQTGVANFLDDNFRETGNIFIFNPPFEKDGIKFIAKAANLMSPGDKMICIMATDMFSPMPLNEIGQPGTFSWLNQRGSFERIEMYRAIPSADIPKERLTFHGITSTCWFVWKKGKDKEKETTIVNSYNETFTYLLTGKETKIPMESWDKIKDYVNWDSENSLYFTQSKPDNKTVVSFRISLKNGIKIKEKDDEGLWASLNVNEPGYKLDKKKFIDFIGKDRETRSRTRILYSKKVVTAINHYPLDKEYFRLKE